MLTLSFAAQMSSTSSLDSAGKDNLKKVKKNKKDKKSSSKLSKDQISQPTDFRYVSNFQTPNVISNTSSCVFKYQELMQCFYIITDMLDTLVGTPKKDLMYVK